MSISLTLAEIVGRELRVLAATVFGALCATGLIDRLLRWYTCHMQNALESRNCTPTGL